MRNDIAQRYLNEAATLAEKEKKSSLKESKRLRFVLISTSVFIVCTVPPLIWFTYAAMREAYYQSAEHSESVAYANLLRRAQRGKAIGAEQQKPIDAMIVRQYLDEGNRTALALRYENRVNDLLSQHNEMIVRQRIESGQSTEPNQGLYRRFVGHPKQLVVKSLEIRLTENNHLLADLRIHGEPLSDDYWANFFITKPDKLAWLFTWDNALRTTGETTLRASIKSDLVSRMQSAPLPVPTEPSEPCLKIEQSANLNLIETKLRLAKRLDDLKAIDKIDFDLEQVNFLGNEVKASIFCEVRNPVTGALRFEAVLCLTSFERNTWKIQSSNETIIANDDNKNQVKQLIRSLERMKKVLNF